jgi:hypothetical protein
MFKTQKAFIEGCPQLKEKLIKAIIKQIGGWEAFKETAEDVANHGADAGFVGFTYYTDTCAFYASHRDDIYCLAKDMSEQLGEEVIGMIRNFRCLGKDYTDEDVGQTLFGSKAKHQTQVANALAWFALEEVCRAFVNE